MLTCDTKWKWKKKKKKMQKRSFEPKDLMMYLKGNSGPYIRERRRFFLKGCLAEQPTPQMPPHL